MGSKLKWVLGIGGALIVVLIVAIYVILSSYNYNNLKPYIAKAAWDATGRKLTIGGDIELDIGLTPALVLTDIKFENARWGSRPDFVKVKRFEVQVALLPLLRRHIEIKRFILLEPDILVETDKLGKFNLSFEAPEKSVQQRKVEKGPPEGIAKLPAFTFNKLLVEKGNLAYRDGQSGKTYNVMLSRFTASATGIDSPVEIALEGNFNKKPFEVTGTLGPLLALVNPGKSWPLGLTAKVANATVAIDGSIKDPLAQRGIDLGFRIQAQDLRELSQIAGKALSLNEPLELAGRATDIGPKTYRISDFKVKLGSNDISGSMEINLAKKPPQLTAMLSSEKLDLRPFLSKSKEKSKAVAKPDKPARVFPDDPLPLDVLEQAEATVKIRAGQILLPQLAVNDLTTDISLEGGRLSVKPIKATIGGGRLNGLITLQSRGKAAAMATQLEVYGFELGKMLKELNISDVLAGNLDVDFNLNGLGRSMATLMTSLDGHTSIVMTNGRINNKYVDLLGADLSASIFRLLNPVKEKTDHTAINCLVSRFDIKKGLADSTALVLDTSRMVVVGEGKIDFRTEELDLALKPVAKEGVGFSGLGKLSMGLGELSKPFKLGGTLAEPSLALDPAQAALTLGKAIGGVALFGPVGIIAALVSGTSGDKNPCLAAIEAAKKGSKVSGGEKPKGVGEGIGRSLKKLFGK